MEDGAAERRRAKQTLESILSLSDLRKLLADNGYQRSKVYLARRCREGHIVARQVGERRMWITTKSEGQRELEGLRQQEREKRP